MNTRISLATLAGGLLLAQLTTAADWITAPSYFTHDPETGQRITQYSPIGPFYTYARPDFERSGFRHTRSTIQAGNSMDQRHLVEEWGNPVRPYGEWRFPYRPYSVPYQAWGPPFAGLGNSGFFPFPPVVTPFADGAGATGDLLNPYSRQQPPPYYDGSYAPYRNRPQVPWPMRRSGRSGPGYPSTGHPSPGYPSTGYPSTGHPSTGYPSTGHPSTGHPGSGGSGAGGHGTGRGGGSA